jgi:hypothetical protein
MAINRDEFERLVARVDRLELGQHATIELVASEIVGLGTRVDEGFAAIDRRFEALERGTDGFNGRMDGIEVRMDGIEVRMDRFERKLDLSTDQVGVAITLGSEAATRNERTNAAILEHFGIEVPEG